MNIEYLKYFAELAKTQHYGQAANALNISQPGLSHAIKTLEEEYGVPLFQKQGRNVSLSQYGKELMKESGIARTFNQLFFSISSLLTFFHFLLYLSKVITKDN